MVNIFLPFRKEEGPIVFPGDRVSHFWRTPWFIYIHIRFLTTRPMFLFTDLSHSFFETNHSTRDLETKVILTCSSKSLLSNFYFVLLYHLLKKTVHIV